MNVLEKLKMIVNLDKATKDISKAKAKLCGGNIKLGNMASFSKLYGNDYIPVKAYGASIKGTCDGFCNGCKNSCYVRKSYRYGSVIQRHAENTIAFRFDLDKAFESIAAQMDRKRKPWEIVRINQSGEIESATEFGKWCELARSHKDTQFYIYTKAFPYVIPCIKSGYVPENVTVLISVWHEYGIAEYQELAHFDNVKAFVYDDNDFDYAANGIEIGTYCKAYNEKGKLDHSVTCDKCRKCFNRNQAHKIIGCKAH